MKIIMDRGLCDAALSFCARCSATYFQKPMGTDRPCVLNVIDDGKDDVLEFYVRSDGRTLHFELTDELQEEFLADFDPALFRTGAAARWKKIDQMAASHHNIQVK